MIFILSVLLMIFQSTLPAGGATSAQHWHFPLHLISIHAPRRGSDKIRAVRQQLKKISIHAPRRGSDTGPGGRVNTFCRFQSTLPAGGATAFKARKLETRKFQSTLPAGGATMKIIWLVMPNDDFNPRSPQGERPVPGLCSQGCGDISIHAPRRGSDR